MGSARVASPIARLLCIRAHAPGGEAGIGAWTRACAAAETTRHSPTVTLATRPVARRARTAPESGLRMPIPCSSSACASQGGRHRRRADGAVRCRPAAGRAAGRRSFHRERGSAASAGRETSPGRAHPGQTDTGGKALCSSLRIAGVSTSPACLASLAISYPTTPMSASRPASTARMDPSLMDITRK